MATLTRWLLRLFADKWSGGLASDTIRLEDRDDSAILDYDTSTDPTTLSVDAYQPDAPLEVSNYLGVALTEDVQEPAGLGGSEYRAEPVLSVRLEGAHSREHGHVDDADAFASWAREAQDIVRRVDNGDLQAAPVADFHLAEPQNSVPNMSDQAQYYSWSFEVAPRGYRTV